MDLEIHAKMVGIHPLDNEVRLNACIDENTEVELILGQIDNSDIIEYLEKQGYKVD